MSGSPRALTFTVLGSGTAEPDPHRGPAAFLVGHQDRHWLVDGGSGTLGRLPAHGCHPKTLAGGFYSHRHPDHCADLVPLLFAMRLPPARTAPYPIWAGAGFEAFLGGLSSVWGHWIEAPAGSAVHELPLDRPTTRPIVGDLVLRTAPATHSAGALHLRWEARGHAVVFSGDTGPSEALVELARGADLLVVECAGSDAEPVPGHLWPAEVARIVDTARPGAVWLTHLYPHVDPDLAVATVARAGVPVRRAEDDDTWFSPT